MEPPHVHKNLSFEGRRGSKFEQSFKSWEKFFLQNLQNAWKLPKEWEKKMKKRWENHQMGHLSAATKDGQLKSFLLYFKNYFPNLLMKKKIPLWTALCWGMPFRFRHVSTESFSVQASVMTFTSVPYAIKNCTYASFKKQHQHFLIKKKKTMATTPHRIGAFTVNPTRKWAFGNKNYIYLQRKSWFKQIHMAVHTSWATCVQHPKTRAAVGAMENW